MNDARRARLGLALSLLAAALLRFWALSQGIGFNPGPDEPEVMERAVRMMKTGDFHPHFFDYPSLYIYLEAAVSTARFLAGAVQGKWSALAQAPTEDFYLWCRAVTALLGTATVWVVYRAALRWGTQTALLASVLMAVMPLHVRESHYTLTDVPCTFVVTLTFLLSLRAHERATLGAFALAGAAAGLAGAMKYNGVLAVLIPVLACVMTPGLRRSRGVTALAIVAAMVGAFLLAAPYTLLDLPDFLNQFARLSSEYRKPPVIAEPLWLVYLKHLRIALQWPGSLLVIGGVGLGLWRMLRGPGRVRWVLAIVFPVVYFRFISHQTILYARYLLPLVPFLSILAAAAVVAMVAWMRRAGLPEGVRHVMTIVLTVLSIAPPAYTAIRYDGDAAKTWTQALAYQWIRRELAAGTSIRLEGSTSPRLPATYKTSYVRQLRLAGPSDYTGSGIQYLVASSMCYGMYFGDPQAYRAEYDDYQRIFAQTEEVARFTASTEHPGPELRILKVEAAMSATLVRRVAWGVALVIGVELAMREIARRSLLHLVLGGGASVASLVVTAIVASAIAIAASRGRRAAGPLLTACFAIGIALQLQLGARLQSDGFYYFAYLRSIAFDHDVNFLNDYRMLGLGDKTYLFQPTRTGHAESAWTIGPAIVWSPFFAVGHVTAMRLHASGVDVATDGTSFPYRQAVCVASLFYGLLGCWFAYRFTRLYFPGRVALPGIALTMTGSFMLWYLVKEPSMTHATSMASVAAFMWMWAATQSDRKPRDWTALGLLIGLSGLIRWQNVLFALLPGLDALVALIRASRGGDRPAVRRTLAGSAIFLAAALVGFLPQMFAWHAIYGSWFARSPVGPQIRWTDPHFVDILWSARNGLFSTTPIVYLAAIGLVVFALARPAIGGPALVAVLVMTYFNACIQDWWGSAGFGGRRFDGLIPLLAIGLAALLDRAADVVRRHAVASVTAMLGVVALGNLALMGAAQEGTVRIGETLAFDRAWAAQARVLHGWFGNPFTYPASLIFALRNGVSPGDYDLLSTNRFLADPRQPYGRIDLGTDGDEWLLEDGWHAPERDGGVTFRWAAAPAMLRVPLDHAAPLRVQVRLHAFAYPNAPQQSLTIATDGGTSCAAGPVPADWQTVECTLDRTAWHAGVNALSLQFTYAQRPMDVGLGGDARPLAAAIDWVRVAVPQDGTAR